MIDEYIKKYSNYLYFFFRVFVGLMFFLHGAQKFGIIGNGSINVVAQVFGFPITVVVNWTADPSRLAW